MVYNTQTAPIFMPNAVGGYMPSQAMTPKVENGKPNSVVYALSRGYVVASQLHVAVQIKHPMVTSSAKHQQ